MKRVIGLLLCGLAVSSCTSTRDNFDAGATALAGSRSLRQASIRNCVAGARQNSTAARHNVALLMDVKDSDVDRLGCRRLVNAVATRRLTYDEVQSMRYGKLTPNFIKILQGR